MIKDITIGNKVIGIGKDVFISAEVGTTHNGNLETAKKLVDAALYAGMDAIKFQIMGPEEIHSDTSETYTYKISSGETKTENIIELLKKYLFNLDQWKELKAYADQKGIIMFNSVDYPGAIDIAEEINMPAYKICSWDLNYFPFIKTLANMQKPVVLDMGPATMADLAKVMSIFQDAKNNQIIVLHCSHTENSEEINLRSIQYIRNTFGVLTGLSSDDRNFDSDFASMAFQPVMIEKRLTLNKDYPGHHHALSLEPEEMKEYVEKIRKIQLSIGEYNITPSKKDLEGKPRYWRRIVADKDIKKGEIFTEGNLDCKRPMVGGLNPMYYELVLGKVANRDLKKNDPITKDDIT